MFPAPAAVFDLAPSFEYLDKECETLFPPVTHNKGVRFVDKLVKVYLLNGHAQFILCHIEIQSSKGKRDLPERMFQYYYRIKDRYQTPVTAIPILADTGRLQQPASYTQEFMGTGLLYWFNSYKILNQNTTERPRQQADCRYQRSSPSRRSKNLNNLKSIRLSLH